METQTMERSNGVINPVHLPADLLAIEQNESNGNRHFWAGKPVVENQLSVVFSITQRGIKIDDPKATGIIDNDLFFGVTCSKNEEEIDLAEIGLKIATDLFITLSACKSRKYGYKVRFLLNEEEQKLNYRFGGVIHLISEVNIAFFILSILAARFNKDLKSILTGTVVQGKVIQQLLFDLGFTRTNLSLTNTLYAIDIKRKQSTKNVREARKELLIDAYGQEWYEKDQAKKAEQREKAKEKAKAKKAAAAIKAIEDANAKKKFDAHTKMLKDKTGDDQQG